MSFFILEKKTLRMNKLWSIVLLCLLAGCTSEVGQTNKAGEADRTAQDASIAEARGEKWQRVALKIGDEDFVRFALKEISNGPEQKQGAARILLGCGYLPSLVIDVPSSVNGDVRLALDDAALVRQKWIWYPKDHFLGPPGGHPGEKKLLAQIMNSKALRFEFTPRNGTPQLATFNMLDMKNLVNQEPVCDFWLPPAR
jgi:hypothetical protein